MRPRPIVGLLALCLTACGDLPARLQTEAAAQRLGDDPERYIVAGVENEEATPAGHAGSSPKGYDGLTVYGPTSRAAQLLRGVERDYALREIAAWPIAPLHMHCAVLQVSGGADPASVVAALGQDPRVKLAQPLHTFSTQTETARQTRATQQQTTDAPRTALYDDPYVGLQRGFQQMDVPQAHAWSRGQGIRVAIIDTGADTRHPDLRGVVVQVGNFVDSDAEQFRRDRHGTELAGIIAAVANNREGIVGIAPGAQLAVFKACWQLHEGVDVAHCNTFTLAQALTAALAAHAQVVNLSLSGPADPLLGALIGAGLRRGVLFIGAAPAEPADRNGHLLALDGVIQVANGGAQGAPGTPLHAPGREILTLLPDGRYDFASGTSLSTAHVTGAVALLLGLNPKLTPAAVYRLLRDTTLPGGDANVGDSVNACAAVAALVGQGSCLHEDASNRVAMH